MTLRELADKIAADGKPLASYFTAPNREGMRRSIWGDVIDGAQYAALFGLVRRAAPDLTPEQIKINRVRALGRYDG